MRNRFTVLFALAAVGGLGVLPTQAVAAAPARVRVLTSGEGALLRAGALRVRVSARRAARVTLTSAGRALGEGGDVTLTRSRTLRFARAGTRTVDLPLTAPGRRVVQRCPYTRVTVAAEVRPRPRARRPRRMPAFTGGLTVVRTARTLPGSAKGCYRLGIASRLINPARDGSFDGQPVHLGGYGFGSNPIFGSRAATGILGQGIHVRALAVSDGHNQFAVADIETQGWFVATKDGPLGLVDIRKAVAARTHGALGAEQVLVQSDHTHGGPDTIGVWGGVPKSYRKFILDRTVDAIVAAFHQEQPVTLRYGTADGRDLLSNQFGYDEQNKVLDSDVRVLQARRQDGRTFATLLNFSAHATVLGSSNTKVTGDWPQEANSMLERRFGGTAITVVGTLGRTQPADRGCSDPTIKAGDALYLCTLDTYARRVVTRAALALHNARPIEGPPVVAARSYLITDPASNALILGANLGPGAAIGADINRAITPPWLTGDVLGTVTASARIGKVLLSSLPGEAYPQIPLTVRRLVPGAMGYMTAGLADDQLGYLIAPYTAYPEPIRRSFFNERGDEVSPIDNDNYFFNVSMTMGQRVICSSLRGAGEIFGKGLAYRNADPNCGAVYANDLLFAHGQDTR